MSENSESTTAPIEVTRLQAQLRTSRIINIVLVAVAVFLVIVVIAQMGQARPAAAPQNPSPGDVAAPQSADSPSAAADPVAGAEPHLRRDANDTMAIGSIDAPVVIAEWTDFRCPYCAVFSNQTLPALMSEYVDKGLVRIEFNDVAFFGEESLLAAVAARAAGEQGLYAEYMSALYAAAPESGHPELPREELIGFAKTAGVPDVEKFTADLDSPELTAAVKLSQEQAQGWGITGVPFFVINGQGISGAQPLEAFQEVINQGLGQ